MALVENWLGGKYKSVHLSVDDIHLFKKMYVIFLSFLKLDNDIYLLLFCISLGFDHSYFQVIFYEIMLARPPLSLGTRGHCPQVISILAGDFVEISCKFMLFGGFHFISSL